MMCVFRGYKRNTNIYKNRRTPEKKNYLDIVSRQISAKESRLITLDVGINQLWIPWIRFRSEWKVKYLSLAILRSVG